MRSVLATGRKTVGRGRAGTLLHGTRRGCRLGGGGGDERGLGAAVGGGLDAHCGFGFGFPPGGAKGSSSFTFATFLGLLDFFMPEAAL